MEPHCGADAGPFKSLLRQISDHLLEWKVFDVFNFNPTSGDVLKAVYADVTDSRPPVDLETTPYSVA